MANLNFSATNLVMVTLMGAVGFMVARAAAKALGLNQVVGYIPSGSK